MLFDPIGSFFVYKNVLLVKHINGDYMKDKLYTEIVDKHKPKENKIKNMLIAFTVGGLIGVFGQYLTVFYSYIFNISSKEAASIMLVTVIFISCLLTSLGFFDNIVSFCKCGLIIPITGFAHSMMSAGLEYKKDGPIYGLGSNIFKLAGSVILYGVVSAWMFGIIRYIFIGV